MHFGDRKNVLEYDDVNNVQRTITYKQRRQIIDGEDVHEIFMKMLEVVADRIVGSFSLDGVITNTERYTLGMKLAEEFGDLPVIADIKDENKELPGYDELIDTIVDQAKDVLARKEEDVTSEVFREAERAILLRTVDLKWMDHIDAMDQLSQSIRMRSIGQHDPVVEYKHEGTEMFDEMNEAIQNDAVQMLMKATLSPEKKVETKSAVSVAKETRREQAPLQAKQVEGAANNSAPAQPIRRAAGTVGRNDPCPCGSGKKYKNCCGKNG